MKYIYEVIYDANGYEKTMYFVAGKFKDVYKYVQNPNRGIDIIVSIIRKEAITVLSDDGYII